jgi:hypothetical protein
MLIFRAIRFNAYFLGDFYPYLSQLQQKRRRTSEDHPISTSLTNLTPGYPRESSR